MSQALKVQLRVWAFFVVLCLAALFPVALRIYSTHYPALDGLSLSADGFVDLAQVDFSKTPSLPLTFGWEFYPDIYLVSDYSTQRPAPVAAQIPGRVSGGSYGSYLLRLDSFPAGENLCVYIPNQLTDYRIYWNQYLVTSNWPAGDPGSFSDTPHLLNRLPVPYNYQGELVIEVMDTGAISGVPVLTTTDQYNQSVSVDNTISGLSYGAVLFCLVMYGVLCISTGKTFQSHHVLLLLLLLILVYFSVRDATGSVIGYLFPVIRRAGVFHALRQTLFLLPPLLLLYNTHQSGIKAKKGALAAAWVLGGAGLVLNGWYIWLAPTREALWTAGAACWLASALIALMYLRRCIQAGLNHALVLACAEISLVLGLVVDLLTARGFYIIQLRLWFPFLFAVFLLLLIFLYQQRVVHLQRQAQQMRDNELAMVQMRLEMQQNNAALMLSQIRPHFLYNALLTIHDVNLENPALANQAIIQFASYLRCNIRSLSSSDPIPFDDELHHIENYVAIEKLRFDERLRMHYNIEYSAFAIPPLTVQPLVENAIKHGVCQRLSGGDVWLRTWAEQDTVHIEIQDNGVGFRVEELQSKDDSIGIKNVRTRLKSIGAVLTLDSTPSVGTTVHITLPKGGKEDGTDQNGDR